MYNQQNKRVSGGRRVALLHGAPTAVQGMHPTPVLAPGLLCCCPQLLWLWSAPQHVLSLCPSCVLPCVLQGWGLGWCTLRAQCWVPQLGVTAQCHSQRRGWSSAGCLGTRFNHLFFAPHLYIYFCWVIFGLNLGLWSLCPSCSWWLVVEPLRLQQCLVLDGSACRALCCGAHPCWMSSQSRAGNSDVFWEQQ